MTRTSRRWSASQECQPEVSTTAGEYPQAGPLSQQAKSAGLSPTDGGDGIYDDVIELGGKTSNGDLRRPSGPDRVLPTASSLSRLRGSGTASPMRPTAHFL